MVLQAGRPGWRREIREDSVRQAMMPLFDPAEYKELWLLALLAEIALQPSGFASNPAMLHVWVGQ
jgi:hypothetical protein